MTIRPIITTAASDQQREEAELTALSSFVTGYEGWLAASRAFANQDDIDPVALASGVVAIHARAKTGFDAGTYLAYSDEAGRGFRFEAGRRSEAKPATIPI